MSDDQKKPKKTLRFPILPTPMTDGSHPDRLLLDGRFFLDPGQSGGLIKRMVLEPKTPGGELFVQHIDTEPIHPFGLNTTKVVAYDPPHPGGILFSKEYELPETTTVKRIRIETDSEGNHYLTLEDE